MKLQGCKFSKPEIIVKNTFQRMIFNKRRGVLYTQDDLDIYKDLYLNHIEIIALPFLYVYEINAECVDGITVGYFFETLSKRVNGDHNYFVISSLKQSETNKETINKAKISLDLRFKIKNIKLYSLGAEAILVTCGFNDDLKQKLEL